MNNQVTLKYPENEIELKSKIDELNNEWERYIQGKCSESSQYVSDGFYPYYTHQKLKILFLGRESRELSGSNYIEIVHEAIKKKEVGGRPLNSCKFHALMLYVTYGIQQLIANNSIVDYFDLPYATEISEDFATQKGISYAFMNLSKFSNESENWKFCRELAKCFLNITSSSDNNFFAGEIELLNPDIIIGMNIDEMWKNYNMLGKLDNPEYYGDNNQVRAYTLRIQNREYRFLDCRFHFAAPRKKWNENYYSPILAAVKAILSL